MSQIVSKIPRTNLCLRLKDLRPGEKAWVQDYIVDISPDGEAYIDENAQAYKIFGTLDWPLNNVNTTFLIERTKKSYKLHLFSNESLGTTEGAGESGQIRIKEIVLHNNEYEPCSCCKGMGYIKNEQPKKPLKPKITKIKEI